MSSKYIIHPWTIVINIVYFLLSRILVERIEPGLQIPDLRDSLIQILRDYNLQASNIMKNWMAARK